MAKQLAQFQINRLARKNKNLFDLANQYKNNSNALTGEYERSFSDYTDKRAEAMKPYEAAMTQYTSASEVYRAQADKYRERLQYHQNILADIAKTPYQQRGYYLTHARDGGSSMRDVVIDGVGRFREDRLPAGIIDVVENNQRKIYQKREAPSFNEVAPVAPTAPKAPVIEEFDKASFDQKRADLDMGYKRELGERRASKANAVGRKQARPLLQGAE